MCISIIFFDIYNLLTLTLFDRLPKRRRMRTRLFLQTTENYESESGPRQLLDGSVEGAHTADYQYVNGYTNSCCSHEICFCKGIGQAIGRFIYS